MPLIINSDAVKKWVEEIKNISIQAEVNALLTILLKLTEKWNVSLEIDLQQEILSKFNQYLEQLKKLEDSVQEDKAKISSIYTAFRTALDQLVCSDQTNTTVHTLSLSHDQPLQLKVSLISEGATVTNSTISHNIVKPDITTKLPPEKPSEEEIQKKIQCWHLPSLSAHFTGRVELLQTLHQELTKAQSQMVAITALHGLGGVGKTQLAIKYVADHQNDYKNILWISADTEEQLLLDYRTLAEELYLPIENKTPQEIARQVKTWFESQSGWLIIYDNVNDTKLVETYKPNRGGAVLVTSRRSNWVGIPQLEINSFSLAEAREYIFKITGSSIELYQNNIDRLAEILGYLPLALAQACAYIAANQISIKDYLKLYEESRLEMLSDNTMPLNAAHEPVAITWNITFKAIKEQQPTALPLLVSCAYLHADSIPEFLLKSLFNKQQPENINQLKPFVDALGCLQQYSMLKQTSKNEEGKTFVMHRLTQDVIYDSLSSERKHHFLFESFEVLKARYPYKRDPQLEDYVLQRCLLPHFEKHLRRTDERLIELSKSEIFIQLQDSSTENIERKISYWLLILLADGYGNLGEIHQKVMLLERVLLIIEKYCEAEHLEVIRTLNNLGNAYSSLGDVQKSKRLLEKALSILEKNDNIDPEEVAIMIGNLSNAYGYLGDVKQQKALLEQALSILEKHCGLDHIVLATILRNLSEAYKTLGSAQKSKELLERAMSIQKKHYGSEHPEVAKTLGNLGNAYGNLGDTLQEKKLLEQALAILKKHYGADHVELASTLESLGNTCGDLGDLIRQKELLERVLLIKEKYYGLDHIQTSITLTNLGNVYRSLDDVLKSKVLLERALSIQEKHYGLNHFTVAATLENLAITYGALGNLIQQKELLERALKIEELYYGLNHVEVAATLRNLSSAYGELGDAQKQKMLLERALVILEKHYGPEHPQVAITLVNLTSAYWALKQLSEAKVLAKRAYQMLLTHPDAGPQHPHTQAAKRNLDWANQILSEPSVKLTSATAALDKENLAILEKQLRNAANQANVELLTQLLRENKALNVNAQDNGQYQRSALHWAILKQAIPCIKVLLAAGADISLTDKAGKSAIDYACELPDPTVLSLLLSHRYQLPLEGEIDVSKLLRRAAHEGDADVIQKVLEKWASKVNEKDQGKTERTALHWAVIKGHEDCVKVLLTAGADASICDKENFSAIALAKKLNRVAILQLLTSSPPTTFFQAPTSSTAENAWQKQIQVNNLELQAAEEEGVSEDEMGFNNANQTVLLSFISDEKEICADGSSSPTSILMRSKYLDEANKQIGEACGGYLQILHEVSEKYYPEQHVQVKKEYEELKNALLTLSPEELELLKSDLQENPDILLEQVMQTIMPPRLI